MHGTCLSRATSIQNGGFTISSSPKEENRFGFGIYFFHGHKSSELAKRWAIETRGYDRSWVVLCSEAHCDDEHCLDLWELEWLNLYNETRTILIGIAKEIPGAIAVTPHDIIEFLARDGSNIKVGIVIVPEGLPPQWKVATKAEDSTSTVVVRNIQHICACKVHDCVQQG